MAIPDFQSVMLPLLKLAAQQKEISVQDAYAKLAIQFGLSSEERKQMLPSGRVPTWHSRVGWAKTYLVKAGLLEMVRRAVIRITERGRDVVRENPEKVDMVFLERFSEYKAFKAIRRQGKEDEIGGAAPEEISGGVSPEELLHESYLQMRSALEDELLNKAKTCSPAFFEKLVVELLVNMGYGGSMEEAGKIIGKVGDGGIDGVIKEDKLGLDLIYVQAKRWEGNVGRPVVQAFVGALHGVRSKKGILVTTSSFTEDAKRYIEGIESKIVLIDGGYLAQLMVEHDLGVSKTISYDIKRLDSDYFADE